jgi:hypothetical protein
VQNTDASRREIRARDVHTFNNHPRMPNSDLRRPESAGNAGPSNSGFQHTSPQMYMNHEFASRPKLAGTSPPFLSTPDLHNRTVPSVSRRPVGAPLPTPPSGLNPVSSFEPVQRSGKRLNLLNPMSLLARRRTSQAVAQLSAESLELNRTRNTFNESFDPRIRGTRVHDFSAPRHPPRKIISTNNVRPDDNGKPSRQYQQSPNPQNGEGSLEDGGRWSGGNYTPVFTENFEEEQYPAAGPHVRKASDLSDLPLPKLPYANGAQKPLGQPSASETADEQYKTAKTLSAHRQPSNTPPPVPPKADSRPEPRRISIDPASTPPKPASSASKRRSRNLSEVSIREGAIPKHMKSTSSRFSFDMIGAAEQERLLEDRHRQKALERKNDDGDGRGEEYEDDYDYDDMMDDDGLEEPIPLIDDDYDEAGLEEDIPLVNADPVDDEIILDDSANIAGLSFNRSADTPVSPYSPGMVSTPRDANGDVIGFAMTKNSPYISIDMAQNYGPSPISSTLPEIGDLDDDKTIQGLGLVGVDQGIPEPLHVRHIEKLQEQDKNDLAKLNAIDEDDLYFDDGLIGELDNGDGGYEFDESVFDNVDTDEYGRPLKAFSTLPTLYSPPTLTTDLSPAFNKAGSGDQNATDTKVQNNDKLPDPIQPTGGLAPQSSVLGPSFPSNSLPTGLTQDTLAAYQEALSAAAFNAAASGKFRRDSIPGHAASSEPEDPQPSLIPDSSHTSRYEPFSPSYELEDDFDYDDSLEDDPIIAAANAEVLASDTDGFYGQEFGFYSAPAGEATYANGGYFGPRGIEGLNRSASGHMVSREPNLTPITERSEYSNRNSMMSMNMFPQQAQVANPGLAQLVGLVREGEYERDISLNALLKLRRGAWGGSQASLHSSTGSPLAGDETSPVGQAAPWHLPSHRRANSGFSLVSEAASETSSTPGSPTLTMNVEPGKRDGDGTGVGVRRHRYTGSADSFSYKKEDDPGSPTGERWVLERRRTSELGEELLEREVVSGGRI